MPEVQHATRPALEPGSVDRIGLAPPDGQEQRRQVRGIVLQVGVLHDDDVAGCRRDAAADGGALPLVLVVVDHAVHESLFRQAIEDFAGAVGGGVVDDDDLEPQGDRADAAQRDFDGREFVVRRYDHCEQQVGGTALFPHQLGPPSPMAISDCPTRQGSSRSSRNSGTSAS